MQESNVCQCDKVDVATTMAVLNTLKNDRIALKISSL